MLYVPLHLQRPGAPRLVLVHGFTQAGEVWREVAERFADRFDVMAPDLPAHGGTSAEYDGADLWEMGRLLGETAGEAVYVGYSLGGRVLLHLAIERPELVRRMVVIGAKAGFRDDKKRADRTASDNALADRIEALGVARLSEFIDEWLQHPVNIRLAPHQQFRELRMRNRPEALASSLRHAGSGPQDPLWERLPSLDMPALIMQAEHDTPVILEDNEGIARAIGDNATSITVPGVGHSIPFEAPELFVDHVKPFVEAELSRNASIAN